MDKSKNQKPKILLLSFILLSICFCSALIYWLINKYGGMDIVVQKITSVSEEHYFQGIFLFTLVQIAQIIISVIPGEPVEVLAGMLYGTFGGLGICIIGILLGTILVFSLTKKYGTKLASKLLGNSNFNSYSFLQDNNRLEYIVFILFLIPGTPKDVLVYAMAFTNIKLSRFLAISTFARIPSIISSTFAGANIGNGNYMITIIVFVITALVGLVGIYIHPKIVNKLKNK